MNKTWESQFKPKKRVAKMEDHGVLASEMVKC
jgi:hypothetical protein